jgi:hypothetical protein
VLVASFVGFVGGLAAAFVLAFLVFGIWRRTAGAPDENIAENVAASRRMSRS